MGKQLPTISSKRARAEVLEGRKLAKSAALAQQMMEAAHVKQETEPEELEVVDAEKVSRLKQFSVAGAFDVDDEKPSMSMSKHKRRAGSRHGSASIAKREKTENSSSTQQQVSPDEIREQMKHDAPLTKVALELGWVPDCFHGLNPEKALNSGAKLGNQTFQAPLWQTVHGFIHRCNPRCC